MTSVIFKRWTITPLLLICLFVSQACGTPGSETSAPEASADEEINVHGDVVFGAGTFNYPKPAAGLADLSGYKATLSLSFTGTAAGQPSQWSKTYVMLAAREPAARQLTIEKTGDLPDLDTEFMAESQGAAYELRADQSCIADAIAEGQSLAEVFEPAGFLTGVIGADEAGSESLNGAQAGHYTFDERALGLVDIAKSTGEMWVAAEGGYLLKYLLTTTGAEDYFGQGSEGTLTWDYELTDIDQPFTIDRPEDCPPGMIDAPLLPDAADVFAAPGMLTYTTATSIAEAAAFYQEQLPELGWSPTSAPDVFETLAVQDFTQGDLQFSVTILAEENGTTVELVLMRIQP